MEDSDETERLATTECELQTDRQRPVSFYSSSAGQREAYTNHATNRQSRIYTLQILESVFQSLVTTAIVIGVEVTIIWNEIEGVHEIASAGQTIPLFLGIGSVAMVLYVRFVKKDAETVLADGPSNKPTMAQPNHPQAWEMGYVSTAYNPPTTTATSGQPVYTNQVHATTWDDLPGAVRQSRAW
jgi:hypothetical protein